MTKAQTQRVRRQLRGELRKDLIAFFKTLTPADLESIFERAMANRRALARQEG